MEDPGKFLRQFYDSFKQMDSNFHVIEQRVPVEVQLDYFKQTEKMRKEFTLNENAHEECIDVLKNVASSKEDVKKALLILATMHQAHAYRLLEEYARQPIHTDEELVHWANMALMESRMSIEAELSDQRQIYISTGLGGKGYKLRFYVLLISSGGTSFLEYQRDIIEKEFSYTLPQKDCEIERLTIANNHVELVFLLPLLLDIRSILEGIVNECNLYGAFISDLFTVTNVRELTQEEINQIIEKYGNSPSSH